MFARFALCAMLAQAQFPFPDIDFRRDVAETETEALFLGPSKYVAGGKIASLEISPDDSRIAYVSEKPTGFEVSIWNRETGRATKILESTTGASVMFQPAGKVLWVNTEGSSTKPGSLYRHDIRSGQTDLLFSFGDGIASVSPAYENDTAMFVVHRSEGKQLAYYGNGRLQEIALPKGTDYVFADWSYAVPAVHVRMATEPDKSGTFTLNVALGTLGAPISEQRKEFAWKRTAFIVPGKGKIGTNVISGYWLQGGIEEGKGGGPALYQNLKPSVLAPSAKLGHLRAFIAADQRSVRMGVKQTIIAHWDRHNLFVREVKSMPIDEFNKLFAEHEKRTLTEQAKQVSMAISIYASDSDNILPTNDGTFDRLFPYAKDSSIFDEFQYMLGPQEVQNPGETVLGRINGRHGRAIVYVDGRVIWEPKK